MQHKELIMSNKTETIFKNTTMITYEPDMVCEIESPPDFSLHKINPNVPFNCTQEEWWNYFHQIEDGQFYPVSNVHQRVLRCLEKQKK